MTQTHWPGPNDPGRLILTRQLESNHLIQDPSFSQADLLTQWTTPNPNTAASTSLNLLQEWNICKRLKLMDQTPRTCPHDTSPAWPCCARHHPPLSLTTIFFNSWNTESQVAAIHFTDMFGIKLTVNWMNKIEVLQSVRMRKLSSTESPWFTQGSK